MRAKIKAVAFFFILGFLGNADFLFALPFNLNFFGGINNLTVDPEQIKNGIAPGDEGYENKYNHFWGAAIEGFSGKSFAYSIKYERSVLWNNTLDFAATFIFNFFSIKFGYNLGLPFDIEKFNFENAGIENWDSGLTGAVRVEDSGVFFVSFGFRLPISSEKDSVGFSSRRLLELKGGYWLPHILIRAGLSKTDFLVQAENTNPLSEAPSLKRELSEILFYFNLEFFSKNIPFRFNFGYNMVQYKWSIAGDEAKDGESNINFIEAGFTLNFGGRVSWFFNGKTPFEIGIPPKLPLEQFIAETGIKLTYFNSYL